MNLLLKFDCMLRTYCSGDQRGGSEDHGRRPAGVDLGRGRAAAARQAAALLRPHPPQGRHRLTPAAACIGPLSWVVCETLHCVHVDFCDAL